ncbi:hypothetical protein T07_1859 [Trichinella nelsoni]|uniref:Uncharacterized protein n=1 Tax=Trichinella nelsoni TaxID=6336 RepID=A0A0V0RAA7_9BILA|nr:hypothetical protein T07_1859 [Trichinella nelsoni]
MKPMKFRGGMPFMAGMSLPHFNANKLAVAMPSFS